jgi:putative addiction module killer protein
MYEIIQSETFERWLKGLKDRQAIMRILARLRRVSEGNLGDTRYLRDGVSEIKLDYGPGYRLYYLKTGSVVIVLLAGGDKSTQDSDIERAIRVAQDWSNKP